MMASVLRVIIEYLVIPHRLTRMLLTNPVAHVVRWAPDLASELL